MKTLTVKKRRVTRAAIASAASLGLFLATASPAAAQAFNHTTCPGLLMAEVTAGPGNGWLEIGIQSLSGHGASWSRWTGAVGHGVYRHLAPFGGSGYAQAFSSGVPISSGQTICAA